MTSCSIITLGVESNAKPELYAKIGVCDTDKQTQTNVNHLEPW